MPQIHTFARSQTTVCLQPNIRLPTGKHSNGASIAPQPIPLRPAKE